MPVRVDIDTPLWRGDTTVIPVELVSGGEPVKIDGARLVFTLKLDRSIPDELAEFTYSADIPEGDPDGVGGKHFIRIERGDLANLNLVPHIYQIQVIYPGVDHPTEITYVWGRIPMGDS